MSESVNKPGELCHDHVFRLDRDRYLVAMAARSAIRHHLMALYAFNIEISSISETVSEIMLGQIRVQWWRDQIANAYDRGPRPAGIAGALHDTITRVDINRHYFETLLDTRERDLDTDPPETLDDLIGYCEGTSSTLVGLSLNLSDVHRGGEKVSDLARHTGIAWALCGLIRAIPHHTARARCFLPKDMLMSAGIDWQYMHQTDTTATLPSLVAVLANIVAEHVDAASRLAMEIPRNAVTPLLVLPLIRHYLAVLRKSRFDVYDPRVQQSQSAGKAFRLMWASWRKRV